MNDCLNCAYRLTLVHMHPCSSCFGTLERPSFKKKQHILEPKEKIYEGTVWASGDAYEECALLKDDEGKYIFDLCEELEENFQNKKVEIIIREI